MSNIIFSINCVLPIFLVIVIGYFLKRFRILNDSFISVSNRLVFLLFLPSMIFRQISAVDPKSLTGFEKIAFIGIVSVTLHFLLLFFLTKPFIKNPLSRGAFIQGCFRSNYALIGFPLAVNLFGSEGAAKSAIMLAVILPFFIVYSVITLSVLSEGGEKSGFKDVAWKIIKNPYIIAVFTGLLFSFFAIPVPDFLGKTLDYMAGTATPLALLAIGAFSGINAIKGNFRTALTASLIKTIGIPLVSLIPVILAGITGADLGVLFILYASPTAVSSFIMAKGMQSDAELAANIIILSTAISCFTIFAGVLLFKNIGLI